MPSSDKLEKYAVTVIACCTVLLTALGVARYLGYSPAMRRSLGDEKVSDWASVAEGRHRTGDSTARVTLVEFADFECPACKLFAQKVEPALRKEFGSELAFVYRHFPLSYHRLAMPFAIGAECAADQGRFWPFHDLAFSISSSISSSSVESIADQAGVPDMARFNSCIAGTSKAADIALDTEQGRRIGLEGTPTLVLNGAKLRGNDSAFVIAAVRKALAQVR
jgi:protein-disulfide isomerase